MEITFKYSHSRLTHLLNAYLSKGVFDITSFVEYATNTIPDMNKKDATLIWQCFDLFNGRVTHEKK